MRTAGFLAITALLCSPVSATAQQCGVAAGFTLPDHGGTVRRAVRKLGPAIVFKSGLRVNTDGAANSYHPIGTEKGALNTICNGIAIIPKSGDWAGKRITAKGPAAIKSLARCQMILDAFRRSRDGNYAILPDVDIIWYAIASRAPDEGHYRPCIQQSGIYEGFFVAQTSRDGDPTKDICDPARWISSTDVPYVTLPGNRLGKRGVSPGDIALVHRSHEGQKHWVVAVAADTGNPDELGEGSVALHAALGNAVQKGLPGNIANDVTTYIFPGRKAGRPISNASLQAQRNELVAALGGQTILESCGK